MPVEIERKYLVDVKRLPLHEMRNYVIIRQGYLKLSDPTVRIRHIFDYSDDTEKAYITVKGKGTVSRPEFEYNIPAEDAFDLLNMAEASVMKKRYKVEYEHKIWEIDQFLGDGVTNAGHWLAEIELGHVDESYCIPPWVTVDVTEDPRYANTSIAINGFPK